jgi:hypothetical protein
VANSNGQRIGGVEPVTYPLPERHLHHFSHLHLIGPAISRNRALHGSRRIFMDFDPPLKARRDSHPFCNPQLKGRPGIGPEKGTLDRDIHGLPLIQKSHKLTRDNRKPVVKGIPGRSRYHSDVKQSKVVSVTLHDPQTQTPGAGIDSKTPNCGHAISLPAQLPTEKGNSHSDGNAKISLLKLGEKSIVHFKIGMDFLHIVMLFERV